MMSSEMKEFIEKNIDLIEDNKWDAVYRKITPSINHAFVKTFTEVLLEAGINPLNYIDYVPNYYLFESHKVTTLRVPVQPEV